MTSNKFVANKKNEATVFSILQRDQKVTKLDGSTNFVLLVAKSRIQSLRQSESIFKTCYRGFIGSAPQ